LLLSVVLLVTLLPAAALAAPPERGRTYIVTLATPDAGETIRVSNRAGRDRMRQRMKLSRELTRHVVQEHGIRARHRYTSVISGFSARLTARQAAALRRDADVAVVRPARRFRLAAEFVPPGVQRVKGAPASSPSPDVDADVAIIDTGIGPVGGNELNVAGGVNCAADGLPADQWQDLYEVGHGTHVAGTIGARDGNGVGVVGVAPGARLWAVRVFDSGGWGDESTVLCGLDWVTSTRVPGGAPPGSQPIDVVNMSIEGSRFSYTEECLPGDPDPIHVAVCAATAAGITIVAAAGNGTTDAASVVPAGYDQVITVGAISDYDGLGWSSAADGCAPEDDDAYAPYSNYGADVDILAPGTCVPSLRRSETGDATKRMTGTSMAAPHVTGAVARYLAANPGTPPAVMHDLVRAAGRLDWVIATDPSWSGVADPDDPHRLLDVAALTGPPELRVWLSAPSIDVSGSGRTRQVRVDLQRGGSYGGQVQLGLTGLPRKVGSASFDRPGSSLVGLGGLGARLRLQLARELRDGRRELSVVATSPEGLTGSRPLPLTVDRTGPKVRDLSPRLRDANVAMAIDGAAEAIFKWDIADRLSGIRSAALQRRIGGGAWRTVAGGARSASVTLTPGRQDRFRVRAVDTLGNSSLSKPVTSTLRVIDSGASDWRFASSGWTIKPSRSAFRGSLLVPGVAPKALVANFSGSTVALVAPVGPARGTLRVRIDQDPWQEVGLVAPANAQRRVVFSRRLAPGEHVIKIQRAAGQVAVDAVLVLD
jgi:subtilisin family serine protease